MTEEEATADCYSSVGFKIFELCLSVQWCDPLIGHLLSLNPSIIGLWASS